MWRREHREPRNGWSLHAVIRATPQRGAKPRRLRGVVMATCVSCWPVRCPESARASHNLSAQYLDFTHYGVPRLPRGVCPGSPAGAAGSGQCGVYYILAILPGTHSARTRHRIASHCRDSHSDCLPYTVLTTQWSRSTSNDATRVRTSCSRHLCRTAPAPQAAFGCVRE